MIQSLMNWLGYEKRAYHPRDPALAELFGTPNTAAGTLVNEHTALNYSAVYRAVSLIAGSVATLPLHIYERVSETERRRADHPLDFLLNEEPNDEMDALTFRETLTGHVLTWGNGYAEIERNGGGNPIALHPLTPDRVTPRRIDGQVRYEVRSNRGSRLLGRESILHLQGAGFDGLIGYSPIRLASEAIGLGLATEQFGATFFGNGSRPGGVLKHPKKLDEEGAKRLRSQWNEIHQGPPNAHKVAVLEEGMSWEQLGVPPEEAQFLQTRVFQIREIARIFGIPPHLLGDLERSTFSNIEHQGIEFVTYCLAYWLRRWEQGIKRALLSPQEKRRFYAEHKTEALVRGDITSRYAAYKTGRDSGFLSINDIRRAENMNSVENGDVYLMPLNMTSIQNAQSNLVNATTRRLMRNEANAVRRAAKKPAEFTRSIDEFYRDYESTMTEALAPAFDVQAAIDNKPYNVADLVRKHIARSRAHLLDVSSRAAPETLAEQIETAVQTWDERSFERN